MQPRKRALVKPEGSTYAGARSARERQERTIFEQVALSVASDQDPFDAAYDAFRDLSEELHDIDTRQYARESLVMMYQASN